MNKVAQYLAPIQELGIKQGDVLFVSSDIKRLLFGYYEKYDEMLSVDDIIDYFQQLVGEQGTLLFPTYNWGFCRGTAWDYYKTKSKTGALGAAALKRKDFKRTQHPIYSFAVWGKDQDLLCAMTNTSSFGADSPFAYIEQHHAKNLVIDVTLTNCWTFAHYIEQQSGLITYRYEKNFTALYRDSQGVESTRTYSMFVRDLDLDVENDFDAIEEDFLRDGVSKKCMIDDIPCTLVDLQASVAPVMDDIRNNRSRKICKYKGQ